MSSKNSSNRRKQMEKKELKKFLAGIGIAGLLSSAGIASTPGMAIGAGASG